MTKLIRIFAICVVSPLALLAPSQMTAQEHRAVEGAKDAENKRITIVNQKSEIERQVGDVTILDLKGKTLAGKGQRVLQDTIKRLLETGRKKILLNLNGADKIDERSFNVLLPSYTTVKQAGGVIKLLLPQEGQDLLILVKLITVFEIIPDEAKALRSFEVVATPSDTPSQSSSSKAPLKGSSLNWIEFSPQEGGFSIMLPGEPSQRTLSTQTENGQVTSPLFELTKDAFKYCVTYMDYPFSVGENDSDKLLSMGAEMGITRVGGMVTSNTPISINRYFGREVKGEMQGYLYQCRVYLVGQRLFMLTVWVSSTETNSENATNFLDSFKLAAK